MNRAYLLSIPELLTEQNLSTIEIKGLAEWSDSMPALFLLLLGARPATCLWPVFDDGNHPHAFLCEWAQAAARLDRLCALVAHHAELSAKLVLIRGALHAQANLHLVLEISELAWPSHGRKFGSKGFRQFMASLAERADMLVAELDTATAAGTIGADQPELTKLIALPASHLANALGYWDPAVEASYWLGTDEPSDVPEFLREFDGYWYDEDCSALSFDPKLGAYEVRSVEQNRPTRFGIATAYGRWLVPLGELRAQTNRHDDQASRSWIVVTRTAGAADVDHDDDRYGLLDANGLEVLPLAYAWLDTVGDKLVHYRVVADVHDNPELYRLMRIDTGEVLPQAFEGGLDSARGDGYIEVGLFGSKSEAGRRGLIDFDGRPVTEFVYSGVTCFHKRHQLAIAFRNGECGLINTAGQLVLPMRYDRIAQKRSDAPPHFHGNATLIFTTEKDGQGRSIHRSDRVGVADKDGRVLAEPIFEPWHLQRTFDENGAMLVHRDGMMCRLYFDGSLSQPICSYAELMEEVDQAFNKRWRTPGLSERTLSDIVEALDIGSCRELIGILCRDCAGPADELHEYFCGMVAAAGREPSDTTGAMSDHEEEESGIQVFAEDTAAAPFFRAMAGEFCDSGLWMHIDWKAVEEIEHAAAHMPDLEALKTFCWDGIANGEGIGEGFSALDQHLSRHGYRLIQYRTGGDEYIVGAVAEDRFIRCLELAQHLGVPLAAFS